MKHQELLKRLSDRHDELSKRLSALKKDLQQLHSADWSEQAQERENDEVLETLAHECRVELKQIELTQRKIEEGHYGLCSKCGGSISAARLEAIPSAQYCVKCAT